MTLGLLVSSWLGFDTLNKLNNEYDICFVLTDSKSRDIINFCKNGNIPLFTGNPRNGKAYDFVKNILVDIIISVNYLFLINEDIINHSNKITFNIHGSLLPKYRGRTPHVWAIINNESFTGITAHEIDTDCDTGRIIKQKRIEINKNDSGADLLEKFSLNYYPLINEVLVAIKNRNIAFKENNNEEATYFGKRTPEDGLINWNWQKERIYNWIRAQRDPYPGAFTFYNNRKLIIDNIIFSKHGFDYKTKNGEVIGYNPNMLVKCPNGIIEIISERTNIRVPVGYILK